MNYFENSNVVVIHFLVGALRSLLIDSAFALASGKIYRSDCGGCACTRHQPVEVKVQVNAPIDCNGFTLEQTYCSGSSVIDQASLFYFGHSSLKMEENVIARLFIIALLFQIVIPFKSNKQDGISA